ncbi:hypothetical protein CSE45_1327 [Citreicella sp. SE45]|nr:hypothetical protein CSE45_1327 [Citreicella sp. SE45]
MLDVFGMSSITTTATGGVDNNGGYTFVLGSDAVTLLPGSTSHVILVIDDTDGCFDDDQGRAQRVDGNQVDLCRRLGHRGRAVRHAPVPRGGRQ